MKILAIAGFASLSILAPTSVAAATESAINPSISNNSIDLVTGVLAPSDLSETAQGTRSGIGRGFRGGNFRSGGFRHRGFGKRGFGNRGGFRNRGYSNRGFKNRGFRNRGFRNRGRNVRFRNSGRFSGFFLPSFFVQPRFFISDFGRYGLTQPAAGYGWSRYNNDAVLTDSRGYVHQTAQNIDWQNGYNAGFAAGQAQYNSNVIVGGDQVVATPSGAVAGQTIQQGQWNGSYQDDGSYTGQWQGTYRGTDGRIRNGQFDGTFTGQGNAVPQTGVVQPHWSPNSGAPIAQGPAIDPKEAEERAFLAQCSKSSGIGGAIVGGGIGALAGNRIAGRGSRTAGTLIGGGVGALAGAALEKGTDRCRKLRKKYADRPIPQQAPVVQAPIQRAPQVVHGQQGYHGGYGYAYPAYYYAPQPIVVTVHSAPTTTTTTTTTTTEEVYYTKAKAKRRHAPRPRKRRPVVRAKPQAKKGCQQECCLYCD